ncbi:MAG: hypothetical protein ABI416_19950 [Ginsengibacter sp.]
MVPFAKSNVPAETIERLRAVEPATFELIQSVDASNEKLNDLPVSENIVE